MFLFRLFFLFGFGHVSVCVHALCVFRERLSRACTPVVSVHAGASLEGRKKRCVYKLNTQRRWHELLRCALNTHTHSKRPTKKSRYSYTVLSTRPYIILYFIRNLGLARIKEFIPSVVGYTRRGHGARARNCAQTDFAMFSIINRTSL